MTLWITLWAIRCKPPSRWPFFAFPGIALNPPQCRVIVAVGPSPDLATGKRPPVYVMEDAPWSAVRNAAHAYGFAAFTVDPGSERGGPTTMKVVYYDVVGPGGQLAAFETFTLQRPRRDQ